MDIEIENKEHGLINLIDKRTKLNICTIFDSSETSAKTKDFFPNRQDAQRLADFISKSLEKFEI